MCIGRYTTQTEEFDKLKQEFAELKKKATLSAEELNVLLLNYKQLEEDSMVLKDRNSTYNIYFFCRFFAVLLFFLKDFGCWLSCVDTHGNLLFFYCDFAQCSKHPVCVV